MDQRVEVFIYHAKCTENMYKKVFKNIEKTAALTHDAFDAFAYAVKEYMEEKNMDIKVGDTVKAIGSGCGYKKGNLYTVARFIGPFPFLERFIDVIDQQTGKLSFGCCASNFEKVEPKKHEGKILIMVDEQDNNKIVARDLITGKKAEARCNPKDEWDFSKGAKLAFERLTEPEKLKEEKGWTGKVVCTSNNIGDQFGWINDSFYPGKVYEVKEGYIIGEEGEPYTGISPIINPKDLDWGKTMKNGRCPHRCSFIEYKGEVTAT